MYRDIYIVRHGNTFDKGDVVTRVGANTDLDLSNSGQAQADALARHNDLQSTVFARALCSPLKRTTQTARTILASNTQPPELEFVDFLREIDYGPDENQPEEDVIARIGQNALDAWENSAIAPDGWLVDTDSLMTAWIALFEQATASLSEDNTAPYLVVTSNGVARFALKAIKDQSGADLKLKTGAYGVIRAFSDGAFAVQEWNVRPAK